MVVELEHSLQVLLKYFYTDVIQSQLWKGRYRPHDYEEYITTVLIIPYIASPC